MEICRFVIAVRLAMVSGPRDSAVTSGSGELVNGLKLKGVNVNSQLVKSQMVSAPRLNQLPSWWLLIRLNQLPSWWLLIIWRNDSH